MSNGGNSHQRKVAKRAQARQSAAIKIEVLEEVDRKLKSARNTTDKSRLGELFRSTPVWGAIGVLFGAIASQISIKLIFFFVGLTLWIEICKAIEVRRRVLGALTSGAMVTVAFFLLWKVTPKPKEPPTLDQIMTAAVKAAKETIISAIPPRQVAEQKAPKADPDPFFVDIIAPGIATKEGTHIDIAGVLQNAAGSYVIIPFDARMWLSFTNLEANKTMIEKCSVELMNDAGKWVSLSRQITGNFDFYYVGNGVKSADYMDLKRFEDQVQNHWLESRENVTGWAFFDYPNGSGTFSLPYRFRVNIVDVAGTSYRKELKISRQNALQQLQPSMLHFTGRTLDLSNAILLHP
jgi:hypothetical protein